MRDSGHYVQFFDAEADFVHGASQFIREGIEADCTCIALTTAEHSEQIDARLREYGLNPIRLACEYRYIALDAATTLANFMRDGNLDPQRFHNHMGLLMRQAASRGQPVYAFREVIAPLTADGMAATAMKIEELWNELSQHHTFRLFCGYAHDTLRDDVNSRIFKQICAVHSEVLSAE